MFLHRTRRERFGARVLGGGKSAALLGGEEKERRKAGQSHNKISGFLPFYPARVEEGKGPEDK